MDIAEMGGSTMSFATRDLILYNIEVLRESLEPAMELLAETVLIPRLLDEEVEEMKMVMELQVREASRLAPRASRLAPRACARADPLPLTSRAPAPDARADGAAAPGGAAQGGDSRGSLRRDGCPRAAALLPSGGRLELVPAHAP